MSGPGFAPATPPPIPASHTGAAWLRDEHLLLWTHTGQARVQLERGQVHRIAAGEGMWIPANRGRRISTDPGSLAFPYRIQPEHVPPAPVDPVRFTVHPGWRDWLLLHYVHLVAPIASFGYDRATLLNVIDPAATAPSSPAPAPGLREHPPLPLAAGARTVAEELLRNPALDHTAEDWAALVSCSARTLRRDFLRGTGMTFTRWRNLSRLTTAGEFLAAGHDIGQVAASAGFSSRSGFARAFRGHHGVSPREYAARARSEDGGRAVARRPGGTAGHQEGPVDRRPLPTTQTAAHTNDVHVLTWIYRGTGYLRIGGRTYARHKGDATWIPAGREHQAGTHTNSIAMPLGHLGTHDVQFAEPLRAHFPSSWDTYLLHCSVSACTRLRPDDFDHRKVLDVFREQLAADRARTVPMPRDARARAAASHFLRRMQDPPAAMLDRATHEAFRRETGMTFTSWQHAMRMRIARELLGGGAKPTSVAGQVGYGHVSNFSRAFSQFHGESPRAYQDREHTDTP